MEATVGLRDNGIKMEQKMYNEMETSIGFKYDL